MAFELPKLPYPKDALSPYISAETLEYHYEKHHAGYVKKLNTLTEGKDEANWSLEDIIKKATGGVFNNGAQVWNHDFYWHSMKKGGGAPSGDLLDQIKKDFGSLDDFKKTFKEQGLGRFGSGYVWLIWNDGKLEVTTTLNADNPMRDGKTPLLTSDLWEHTYYIDYRNDRGKYLDAFLDNLVNWDFAAENFQRVRGK